MKLDTEPVKQEQSRHGVIPEIVKLAAYRIVEESMNNIIKHSQADNATVQLEYNAGSSLHMNSSLYIPVFFSSPVIFLQISFSMPIP